MTVTADGAAAGTSSSPRTGFCPQFDQAIADFAEAHADQNELDYAALQTAVKDGKAEATTKI
jgi:hypothetical protein